MSGALSCSSSCSLDTSACEPRCTDHDQCGDGLFCQDDGSCKPGCLNDLDCNDSAGAAYCDTNSGQCYADVCEFNPCADIEHATECQLLEEGYRCGCGEDFIWNASTQRCDSFTCDAIDLGTFEATFVRENETTCGGSSIYNARGNPAGTSCTGFSTRSNERVYRLTLPPHRSVRIVMESSPGFDASLWVTTSCTDLDGSLCVAGADNPETLVLTNYQSTPQTFFVIADANEGCGEYSLRFNDFGTCGNGVLEGAELCDGSIMVGATCVDAGFAGGELGCNERCSWDTSACNYGALQPAGGPCDSDSQCASGTCRREVTHGLPGGYCTASCTNDSGCWDDNDRCEHFSHNYQCIASCTPDTDSCREGYTCLAIGDGDGVCWPDCSDDSHCALSGHCNLTTGLCECAPGTHAAPVTGECVFDTCESLSCHSIHRHCDPTGGCEGACAACSTCLPGKQDVDGECVPLSPGWGGACTEDIDCPGTGSPGDDTFCLHDGPDGYCQQNNGPDYISAGQPCRGDRNSIGFRRKVSETKTCLQRCEDHVDCRPGYYCSTEWDSRGTASACIPITSCETFGCNASSGYTCQGNGTCQSNSCAPEPCLGAANSNGECFPLPDNDWACGCDSGFAWDAGEQACKAFFCRAGDLGIIDDRVQLGGMDTCGQTSSYDAAGSGLSCTGYSTGGYEQVFQITVPAETTLRIVMEATTFDAALWVTTVCNDTLGAACVGGADNFEELLLTNSETTPQTYFVVADARSSCGRYELIFTPL